MKTSCLASLGLALALSLSASLHAQVVTPNPAPTIITTQPYTINAPGYYQLGTDLSSSATSGAIITINASNVTLDFAGHYISGPSTNTASIIVGVLANERGNLLVRNGTVAYCFQGIAMYGNGQTGTLNINQHVDNMLISYCYYTGVQIYQGVNSVISNCRVSFTGGSTASGITAIFGIVLGSAAQPNNLVDHCIVSTVASTAANTASYGITCQNATISNCAVAAVTSTGSGGTAAGYFNCNFALNNTVDDCSVGFTSCAKYKDNVTLNCTTPFYGGTAVGTNN